MGYPPFYLLYGYNPSFTVPAAPTAVPAENDRIDAPQEARNNATAALNLTAEHMKGYSDRHVNKSPNFKDGQKVWPDMRNLSFKGLPRKLADKFAGPYKVKRRIRELAYELNLPSAMKIHPVFHVSLLQEHCTSTLPGRHPSEPTAIEVDSKEEYEVEAILDSRRWCSLQYLVCWKGYGHQEKHPSAGLL